MLSLEILDTVLIRRMNQQAFTLYNNMIYTLDKIEPSDNLELLEELKLHLGTNNGTAEDDELSIIIDTALSLFEAETNRTVLPTQYRQSFFCWSQYSLDLARGKVRSIESVKYYDDSDTLQTLPAYNATSAPEGWRAELSGDVGRIYVPSGVSPSTSLFRLYPIQVEFTAGTWASQDYLPSDVLFALLQCCGHLYRNRESHSEVVMTEVPLGFQRLCNLWKTGIGAF